MRGAARLCVQSARVLVWELCLVFLSALICVNLGMIEESSPLLGGKSSRLKKSDRDLSVCADPQATASATEAVILWDSLASAKCTLTVQAEAEEIITIDASRFDSTGYMLTDIDPEKEYSVSVNCVAGNIAPSGSVRFQTGTHFSSSECTSAKWLGTTTTKTGANVTSCLEQQGLFSLNATLPLENCTLREERPGEPATERHIHILPFTATVNTYTLNTTLSVTCLYPGSTRQGFQSDKLTYSEDLKGTVCYTKLFSFKHSSVTTPDPAAPSIVRVHQTFTTAHVGIFVLLLIVILAAIIFLTTVIVKRIRLQHRRQGQRLLVNEDPMEAAFRDLQEMDT